MREKQQELDINNVRIVVITFEVNLFARQYRDETQLSWPLLIDETRSLYKSYGMFQAGFMDIWGPSTWLVYLKELLKGRLPKRSSGDIEQRGGDVLIGPDNIVRMHHIGKGPADRPKVDSIIRVVSLHQDKLHHETKREKD